MVTGLGWGAWDASFLALWTWNVCVPTSVDNVGGWPQTGGRAEDIEGQSLEGQDVRVSSPSTPPCHFPRTLIC